MKIISIILLSLFLGVLGIQAGEKENIEEYVSVINKRLLEGCTTNIEAIKSWKDGIKEAYGYDLDHLEAVFKLVKFESVKHLGEDKVIVGGYVTTTAFAYKDTSKIRAIQVVFVMYLMNKEKVIEDKMIVAVKDLMILDGWFGIML